MLKTGTKVLLGFGALLLLALLMSGVGIWNLHQAASKTRTIYTSTVVPLSEIGDAAIAIQRVRVNVYAIAANAGNIALIDEYHQRIGKFTAEIATQMPAYEKQLDNTKLEETQTFIELKEQWANYQLQIPQIEALARAGKSDEARALLGQLKTTGTTITDDTLKLYTLNEKSAQQVLDNATRDTGHATWVQIIFMVVGLLITVIVGWVITRGIARAIAGLTTEARHLTDAAVAGRLEVRGEAEKVPGEFRPIIVGFNKTLDAVLAPITEADEVLERLANKDLTARIVGDYQGDHARIKDNMNQACDALEETVRAIRAIAQQVADSARQVSLASASVGQASEEVASGAQQVATGSESQTRSATEAATHMDQLQRAIEEVARGVEVTAHGAEQAAQAAQESLLAVQQITDAAMQVGAEVQNAGNVARQGSAIVSDTVEGMHRVRAAASEAEARVNALGKASKKIGEIVEAINEIAEQTNLLALNAAIEAARAGEHGKGFAVVADEVRKLAERSAGQTKEIAALIEGIQEGIGSAVDAMGVGSREVEQGVLLTNRAGTALHDILTASEKVAAQAERVAEISKRVAEHATDVLTTAESVSSATQQSNAATEEMASSSIEVTRAVEHVVAIIEQASAVAEELSAAAEEQNASTEEMTAVTAELADLAGKATELLDEFTVTAESHPIAPVLPTPGGNGAHGRVKVKA